MLLKSHDFQVSEGKCLRCTYPLISWHERNRAGERRGTAGDRGAAQGHPSPTLPLIVMKILGQDQRQVICMEN